MLPIPGLDGFGIIRPWLPYPAQDLANTFGQSAIFIVFIVLWFVPSVNQSFFGVVYQISDLAGIDRGLIDLARFAMPHLR
jgi:Zn-dependent protease